MNELTQYDLDMNQKQYELLVANDSNYVYEVDMYPGSPGDKYLCPSYESVYITIGSYEKAYKEFIDNRVKNNIIIMAFHDRDSKQYVVKFYDAATFDLIKEVRWNLFTDEKTVIEK